MNNQPATFERYGKYMREDFKASINEDLIPMIVELIASAMKTDLDEIDRDGLRDDIKLAVGRSVLDRFSLSTIPAILRNDTMAYVIGESFIQFKHTLKEDSE